MKSGKANNRTVDSNESGCLLKLLDGLPLAIAQAGAYLQESGVGLATYLRFYEQQWSELMESGDVGDAPLQDYPERSVWTTWAISYQAIRDKHKPTANLLLLWSFLDNKDLWYGLFAAACRKSAVASMLSEWVGDVASSELAFSRAMQRLRSYSLIEEVEETASYATHPVVHRWARHYQGEQFGVKLGRLAVVIVGLAVPRRSTRDYTNMQRRLLPHAQASSRWTIASQTDQSIGKDGNCDEDVDKGVDIKIFLRALHLLGSLYTNQGKLVEAEQMYEQALRGKEEALGPKHTSTLDTVNNLGLLYKDQGKLVEAEQMYERALRGYEEVLGPKHTSTLNTVNNLGILYKNQGKLVEVEQMYERALRGKEEALGSKHTSTLNTVNNLGNLYKNQGKLVKAEQMYERALPGYEEVLGPKHTSTLNTVNNLGILYKNQGKLVEAEQMYERALRGYEEALGDDVVQRYRPALNTMENMGDLYVEQQQYSKAQAVYAKALSGWLGLLGQSSTRYNRVASKMRALPSLEAEQRGRVQSLAV